MSEGGQEKVLPIRTSAACNWRTGGAILASTPEAVIEFLVAAGLYSERRPCRLSGNRYVFLNEPIPPAVGPVFQEHPDGHMTVWRQ